MSRYTVKTDIPIAFKAQGIVAWIHDAQHPDDPSEGASCGWYQDRQDAVRVCRALNAEPALYRALQDFVDRWQGFPGFKRKPTHQEIDAYVFKAREALDLARTGGMTSANPCHMALSLDLPG